MGSRTSEAPPSHGDPPGLGALLRTYRTPLLLTAGLVALYLVHTRPARRDLARLERVRVSVEEELDQLLAERDLLEERAQAALEDPLYHERLMNAHFGTTVFPEAAMLRDEEPARAGGR